MTATLPALYSQESRLWHGSTDAQEEGTRTRQKCGDSSLNAELKYLPEFCLLGVRGLICSMNSSCLLSVIAFCSLYSTIFIPGKLILELSSGAGERKSCQAQSAFPEEIRPRGTGGNGRQEQTALIPCRNCVQRHP